MTLSAILLMGGKSERFSPTESKQYIDLNGKPLYQWALDTLIQSELFDEIILVGKDIEGGKTRQESSFLGIKKASSEHVLIHDGARPFVSLEILHSHINALKYHDAVNTCVPAIDTINIVEMSQVISIPPRHTLMQGQTPQSFRKELILKAHTNTKQTNATDDCSLILELGYPVHVVLGSQKNFKITTPFDLAFARSTVYSESL